ncbi:YbjQ family protein [Clostridium sp. D2Q-14]|uniref:YbjQ family protein n=1 Tax=Anaeromonas gelatinilytica TaxID=2683194 RepID=UPI00193B3130|nr:YbjQ family protein [Anaeromonas gelatinilytica]MBS4535739.1 YbjQ family protein [Anaeromonas gelatinilytica]
MLLVNTDYIKNVEITESLGLVKGSTIRAKHIGKDIAAGLKHLVGGEIAGYSQMIDEARQIATSRMVEEAEKLGADAIINIRYSTTTITQGAAEILIYGTAVKNK